MKVKGIYIRDENSKPLTVSGVNVSKSSTGSVLLSFFKEIPARPDIFEMEISNEGEVLSSQDMADADFSVERIEQCILEMDSDTAAQIINFLHDLMNQGKDSMAA